MKKYFILFFPLACMILLLNSCEYQLKEDYYRELNKRDSANISVNLDSTDSFFNLSATTRFSFHAQTNDLKLLVIRVFVDSNEILNYGTSSGIFSLDNMSYSDGDHQLDIVVTTHSGTGSFADILGAEGFIFTRSWMFFVDNSDPDPVNITSIFNDRGLLKIEWERYTRINFKKYEVLKILSNGSTMSMGIRSRADQNFFYDSAFIGGIVSYKVRVFSLQERAAEGSATTFSDEIPVISARSLKGSMVELSWNKCKYYKAFKNYMVSPYGKPTQIISDVNTTTIVGDYGILGETVNFWLLTNAQIPAFHDYVTSNIDFAIGQPFMKFNKFYKNQVNEDVIVAYATELYRYNTATGQILQSGTQANDLISYIYSPLDEVLLRDGPKEKLNPATFSVMADINYLGIVTGNLSNLDYGIVFSSPVKALFDFKNMVVVSKLNLETGYKTRISEDSKYVLQYDNLTQYLECYNIENGQVTLKWAKPAPDYLFIPGNAGQVMIFTNPGIEIRSVETFDLISSFSTISVEMLDIDPLNKLVMCRSYSGSYPVLELYNYETGQKVNSFTSVGEASIKDGIIYSSAGRSIAVF